MQTPAIIEDYIIKAIQCAEFERLEEGGCTAWVPGFPGLIAVGRDGKACLLDLWRHLDDWIAVSAERGLELPALGGIDLRADRETLLAAGKRRKGRKQGQIFESTEE